MPWSCLLCPSGRPSSSHPDPQLGVASIGGQPGLQGTEGHSLGRGIPGWKEPGGARKDNGEEEECVVFLTRPLTIDSFIPVRLINVFLKSEVTAQSNTVGRLRFFFGGEMLENIRVDS